MSAPQYRMLEAGEVIAKESLDLGEQQAIDRFWPGAHSFVADYGDGYRFNVTGRYGQTCTIASFEVRSVLNLS